LRGVCDTPADAIYVYARMAKAKGSCRDALSLMGDVTNVLFTYLAVCMLRSILQIINSLSRGELPLLGIGVKQKSCHRAGVQLEFIATVEINFKRSPEYG
jgi:hypothetical protein